MITYIYETIPKMANEEVERFEWQQSIHDDALVTHPRTGAPVRRVVAGGLGYISSKSYEGNSSESSCCRRSCGC